jgi:hypothetical protein
MIPSHKLRSGMVCNYYSGIGEKLLSVVLAEVTSSGLILKDLKDMGYLGRLHDSKYLHKCNTSFVDVKIWLRDNQ